MRLSSKHHLGSTLNSSIKISLLLTTKAECELGWVKDECIWGLINQISSDDNCSLLNKKSVLQTKYRPLFLQKTDQIQTISSEITDQNLKCHSKECKTEKKDTMLKMIVQRVYFDIITEKSNPIYQTFVHINKGVQTDLNQSGRWHAWKTFRKSKNTNFLGKYRPITDHF